MERRAVPGELSGRRGVATLVCSFPGCGGVPVYRRKPSPKSGSMQQYRRQSQQTGWNWDCVSAI